MVHLFNKQTEKNFVKKYKQRNIQNKLKEEIYIIIAKFFLLIHFNKKGFD